MARSRRTDRVRSERGGTRPRKGAHRVRIIGGAWRGRRLTVAEREGLRPTPDRVRETLFNWLAPVVPGAVVLDAFAGAGALGFEAASRGAATVTLVERDPRVAALLRSQAAELTDTESLRVVAADVLAWLPAQPQARFDLVFIDPPYARPELRSGLLQSLIENQRLTPGALLYLEWPKREQDPLKALETDRLTWIKQKQAGEVAFALARWNASS